MNYYNEFDKGAAQWLRELISEKLIPEGHVDERSICEVKGSDLAGYVQCHFFAGIGGWPEALRLAGWGASRHVWTGSCPCQPFSEAGKGLGQKDARHLWPEMFRLICECGPNIVFGEQVEAAVRHGWLDGVSTDLEAKDYAFGAVVLGAHSVGAPHIRQRIYWLADSANSRREFAGEYGSRWTFEGSRLVECGAFGVGLADTKSERLSGRTNDEDGRRRKRSSRCNGKVDGLGDSVESGSQRLAGNGGNWSESGRDGAQEIRSTSETGEFSGIPYADGAQQRVWNECDNGQNNFILCRDKRTRRIPSESALFPLADGFKGSRVGLLRGAGNAIVPQVAAEFIKAYLDCTDTDF